MTSVLDAPQVRAFPLKSSKVSYYQPSATICLLGHLDVCNDCLICRPASSLRDSTKKLLTRVSTLAVYIIGPSVDQFISRDKTIVCPFHSLQDLSGFSLVLTSKLEVIRDSYPACSPIGGYLRDVCVDLSYVCSLDKYSTTLNVCSSIQWIPVVSYLTLAHDQDTHIEPEIRGWDLHSALIRRPVRIRSLDPDISVSST